MALEGREQTYVYESTSGRWVGDRHEAYKVSEISSPVQSCLLQCSKLTILRAQSALHSSPGVAATPRLWQSPVLHFLFLLAY